MPNRNYLICCDESGMHGSPYYGFGSLWMPWERRGDFQALVADLRRRHRNRDEMKWKTVDRQNLAFFKEVVDAFFTRTWLMFHCLVVRKGYVKKELHGTNAFDTARRKQFSMLIKSKIQRFAGSDKLKTYHVWVDRLPSSYDRADEAAKKIIDSTLRKELGLSALHSLVTKDSKESPGIQMADLLVGAVVSAWNTDALSPSDNSPKALLRKDIARHLGWADLRADTFRDEWKFNIWYFYDPTSGSSRECKSRPVHLLRRMPTPASSPRQRRARGATSTGA